MNYHRIFQLIFSCLSYLFVPFSYIAKAFFEYPSLDAKTRLHLDSLARETTATVARRTRFKSFISRALSHANFTAGMFDPGRALA